MAQERPPRSRVPPRKCEAPVCVSFREEREEHVFFFFSSGIGIGTFSVFFVCIFLGWDGLLLSCSWVTVLLFWTSKGEHNRKAENWSGLLKRYALPKIKETTVYKAMFRCIM